MSLTLDLYTPEEAATVMMRAARTVRSGKSPSNKTNLLALTVSRHEERRDTPEAVPCFLCGGSTATFAAFFTAIIGLIDAPTSGEGGVICPDCYVGTKQEMRDRIITLRRKGSVRH